MAWNFFVVCGPMTSTNVHGRKISPNMTVEVLSRLMLLGWVYRIPRTDLTPAEEQHYCFHPEGAHATRACWVEPCTRTRGVCAWLKEGPKQQTWIRVVDWLERGAHGHDGGLVGGLRIHVTCAAWECTHNPLARGHLRSTFDYCFFA